MALSDTETHTIIVDYWIRLTDTHKKHLSLTHILSIILNYSEPFRRAFISNTENNTLYSCAVNLYDLTKPFFTNPKQIQAPIQVISPNGKTIIPIFQDQRPNYPSQFILRYPNQRQFLYDFETSKVIKEFEPLERSHNRYQFLDENFVIFPVNYYRGGEFKVQHIFKQDVKDIRKPLLAEISGKISSECVYCVNDLFDELILCWVLDEQKETVTVDIPVDREALAFRDVCWKNKIFVTTSNSIEIQILAYDIDENAWLEKTVIPRSGWHQFFVYDDNLLLVCHEKGQTKMEVWVLEGESDAWEKREFDLPSGFESGWKVLDLR